MTAAATGRAPSAWTLTAVHTRYQVLEGIRVPIFILSVTVFPAMSMLLFVIPQPFAQDPLPATGAATQLALFAVLSVCLFTFGVGVAEDRASPWDPFVRTLPVGPVPRLAARLVSAVLYSVLGMIPLIVLAGLLTAASVSWDRLLLGVGALLASGVPLLGLGLAIGYALSSKAALAVAQLLLLPLAFGGGLFVPPTLFPSWLDAVSTALPSRAGRDLAVTATTGAELPLPAVPVLVGWSVLLLGLAVVAYRRDEGRRFR